jgi:hypothetical protein
MVPIPALDEGFQPLRFAVATVHLASVDRQRQRRRRMPQLAHDARRRLADREQQRREGPP